MPHLIEGLLDYISFMHINREEKCRKIKKIYIERSSSKRLELYEKDRLRNQKKKIRKNI